MLKISELPRHGGSECVGTEIPYGPSAWRVAKVRTRLSGSTKPPSKPCKYVKLGLLLCAFVLSIVNEMIPVISGADTAIHRFPRMV